MSILDISQVICMTEMNAFNFNRTTIIERW